MKYVDFTTERSNPITPANPFLPQRVYFPTSYANSDAALADIANLRVVLFMHGAGERSNTFNATLLEANPLPERLATSFNREGYIFICPQCPTTHWWYQKKINLVDMLDTEYPNAKSYDLTGLSAGGYGCYAVMEERPHMFNTMGVLCGNDGDMVDASGAGSYPTGLKTAVRHWHGTLDTTVTYASGVASINRMVASGYLQEHTLVSMDGYAHNIWDDVYTNDDLYFTWLDEKRAEEAHHEWSESFEGTLTLNQPWFNEGEADLVTSISTEFSIDGSKSYKAEMTAQVYANARDELRTQSYSGVGYVWEGVECFEHNRGSVYSKKVAIYFPSDYKFDSAIKSVIMQYHGGDLVTRPVASATLAVYEINGAIQVWTYWDDVRQAGSGTGVVHTHPQGGVTLGTITKGSWHYFHLETQWDWRQLADGGTGYLKMWMSKTGWPTSDDMIIDYSGPTGYHDDRGSIWKMGIYKYWWKFQDDVDDSIAAGCDVVTRYFDSFTTAKGVLPLRETPPQYIGFINSARRIM